MPVEDTVPAVRKAGLTVAAMYVSMAEKKAATVSMTGATVIISMVTGTRTGRWHLLKNLWKDGMTVRNAVEEKPEMKLRQNLLSLKIRQKSVLKLPGQPLQRDRKGAGMVNMTASAEAAIAMTEQKDGHIVPVVTARCVLKDGIRSTVLPGEVMSLRRLLPVRRTKLLHQMAWHKRQAAVGMGAKAAMKEGLRIGKKMPLPA